MKKVILGLVFGSMVVFAGKPVTPTLEQAKALGINPVTVEQAKKLYDEGIKACDARKKFEYAQEHIKGAISTYYNEKGGKKNKKVKWDRSKDRFDVSALPQKCIYYCNGPKCWKSYKAAIVAHDNGKTAYWLRAGLPGWKKAGFPTE
jgi:rhodanese-related sulfurtransferase